MRIGECGMWHGRGDGWRGKKTRNEEREGRELAHPWVSNGEGDQRCRKIIESLEDCWANTMAHGTRHDQPATPRYSSLPARSIAHPAGPGRSGPGVPALPFEISHRERLPAHACGRSHLASRLPKRERPALPKTELNNPLQPAPATKKAGSLPSLPPRVQVFGSPSDRQQITVN